MIWPATLTWFLVLWLVPTFIAAARNRPDTKLVAFYNVVLGWTGVVWIGLLLHVVFNPAED